MLSLLRSVAVGAGPCEQALWLTLTGIAYDLQSQESASNPQTPGKLDMHGKEEVQLAKQLVNLLMPFLRSAVRGTGPRAILCLTLLSGLMKSATPTVLRAVASELMNLGMPQASTVRVMADHYTCYHIAMSPNSIAWGCVQVMLHHSAVTAVGQRQQLAEDTQTVLLADCINLHLYTTSSYIEVLNSNACHLSTAVSREVQFYFCATQHHTMF